MDRRDQILMAAASVFAQHGFRGSTTRRIADAAGVNEITIFRYFGTKEVLLQEAMQHLTDAVTLSELPAKPVDPARELTDWSESFLSHLRLRSAIIRKTMSEIEERPEMGNCASHTPRRASADLCRYMTALKKSGLTQEKFDSKTAAAMLMGTLFADAMGRGMMPDVYPQPEAKAAEMYTGLLLRALGVAPLRGRRPAILERKLPRAVGLAIVSLLLAAVAAGAQTFSTASAPRQLSLADAVRAAESQSEAVRIARAGVQRAQGQQYQARSQRLPQLFGSAGYTRTLASQFDVGGNAPAPDTTRPASPAPPCDGYLRGANAPLAERVAGLEDAARCAQGADPFAAFSSLPFGQENQYSVGLSFSQNLFSGGRISAQNSVANAGRRFAEIELAAQRAQIRLDVTQAYFDAALADRLVSLAESSSVQTENVLRQTQLGRNVGNVSEFDLLRAQVSSANQRPVVIQRRSDRQVAYFRLKQLLNVPLDNPLQLTTFVDDPATADAVLAGADFTGDTVSARRSSVRQASEAVEVQRGLLRVARAQRLPSLALTSQYGKVAFPQSGFPSSGDFRTNWTVGIATQFPIFTGGRIKGEQLVAEANVREAQARVDQLREFASLDARVALNALEQARAAWQASLGTAEQAARAYSIAEVRYREGISTQIELSDARLLLEQAVANRALAARNLQVARVKLELLPDLPVQIGGSAQSQQQAQIEGIIQQSQAQSARQAQQQEQQAQQQQSGIPPQ